MSGEDFTNFKNSAIATATAEFLTLPICTTKTVYQNNHMKSIGQAFGSIYRTQGIIGFYKASIPSITGQVFTTASKYSLYNHLKTHWINNSLLCGALSGVLVSTISHTADVVKVHMQMNSTELLQKILNNPIKTLYSGYRWTFIKAGITGPLFFPLNDYFKHKTNSVFFGSLITSVISTTLMQPLDYFKTRSMYGNQIDTKNLFKGLSLNLMRVVPHFVIVMTTIDYLKTK